MKLAFIAAAAMCLGACKKETPADKPSQSAWAALSEEQKHAHVLSALVGREHSGIFAEDELTRLARWQFKSPAYVKDIDYIDEVTSLDPLTVKREEELLGGQRRTYSTAPDAQLFEGAISWLCRQKDKTGIIPLTNLTRYGEVSK